MYHSKSNEANCYTNPHADFDLVRVELHRNDALGISKDTKVVLFALPQALRPEDLRELASVDYHNH